MSKTKKFTDAYFRFLMLKEAVQELPSVPHLEPAAERLLSLLASGWFADQSYSVSEAMQLHPVGSPATVYRKLQQLQQQGLIETQVAAEDPRIKRMVPTRRALDYFDRLGRCFEKAQPR